MNTNSNLTKIALLSAIMVLLGIFSLYLPIISIVTIFLMPIPLVILIYQCSLKDGFLAVLVTFILLFILSGNILGIIALLLQTVPVGLLLGLVFKNNVSSGKGMAIASLGAALSTVLIFLLAFWFTGINPFVVSQEMTNSMQEVLNWYEKSNLISESSMAQLKDSMEQTMELVALLIPGNLVIWSLVSVYITYLLSYWCFRKLNISVLPISSFKEWKLPWYMIWGIILGLFCLLIPVEENYLFLSAIGKNILYIMGFLYFICGISLLVFLYQRWKIIWVIKIIFLILIIIYGFFVFILLGFLDSIINIRRFIITKDKGE